jgi:hypothetical protein
MFKIKEQLKLYKFKDTENLQQKKKVEILFMIQIVIRVLNKKNNFKMWYNIL